MSQKINKTGVVPFDMYGQRADIVLAELFSEFSRSQLTQWLKSGFITFDDKILKPKEKVTGGESVILQAIIESVDNNQPENIPLSIIHEDDSILVINKPASLVVHPGAGNLRDTLVNALLFHCKDSLSGIGGIERPGIIHRLDKMTSGIVIVAKNDLSHKNISSQFKSRSVQKYYRHRRYQRWQTLLFLERAPEVFQFRRWRLLRETTLSALLRILIVALPW